MLGSANNAPNPPLKVETEQSIIQKLKTAPTVGALKFYLCLKESYLITALNNHDTILKERFSSEDIISIACTTHKNCQLIVDSLYFRTLDKTTQDEIQKILKNYIYIRSRFSSSDATPPASPISITSSPPS